MALIDLFVQKHLCPACNHRVKFKDFKHPPTLRHKVAVEAGDCPHCQAPLDWFDDRSQARKMALVLGLGSVIGVLMGGAKVVFVFVPIVGILLGISFAAANKLALRVKA